MFYLKPNSGSPLTDDAADRRYRPPDSLNGRASFDRVVGAPGPRGSAAMQRRVEAVKFCRGIAGSRPEPWKEPLRPPDRWCCTCERSGLDLDRVVIERLRREPVLS